MKNLLIYLLLLCSVPVSAQKIEMPSRETIKKQKIKTLELRQGSDNTGPAVRTYTFNSKGLVIHEKGPRTANEKQYHTTYAYDKKGRVIEATTRHDDGSFRTKTVTTWSNDSARRERLYANTKDSTDPANEFWYNRKNQPVRYYWYSPGTGKVNNESRVVYDDYGKNIGGYDSSATLRVANEYMFYQWKKSRRYDATGQFVSAWTITYDSTGLITALKDSSASGTTLKYVVKNVPYMEVYANGQLLSRTELSDWEKKYHDLDPRQPFPSSRHVYMNVPPPPPYCFAHAPLYDKNGLIRKDVVDFICGSGSDEPMVLLYRYGY